MPNDQEENTTAITLEQTDLVFIQCKGNERVKVYQNGIELKGIVSIEIHASVDKPTTHKIEYLTGMTK